jgi:surface antigen
MSTTAATIGALSVLVCASAVGQGNMGFLQGAPASYLTGDDVKLLREALSAVLQGTKAGTSQTWQNAASGNSGKITLVSSFNTQDSRECRQLRIETRAKNGIDNALTTNMCRSEGDQWKVDAEAQPGPATR